MTYNEKRNNLKENGGYLQTYPFQNIHVSDTHVHYLPSYLGLITVVTALL